MNVTEKELRSVAGQPPAAAEGDADAEVGQIRSLFLQQTPRWRSACIQLKRR
jgi:hypothetical protein